MRGPKLRIRKVRRYRVPRYPSPWRPWGDPLRRSRRAAAALALPATLGLAVGCREGGGLDNVAGGIGQYCPPGYFTKAEALAVVERAFEESDWTRLDGCPTVPDRWLRNVRYEWSPPVGLAEAPVVLELDWLAPAETLPVTAECPGPNVRTVGLAVWGSASDERPAEGDGQAWSANSLACLRRQGEAAVLLLDAQSYPFEDDSGTTYCQPGWDGPPSREQVEARLEEDVRSFVNGLRSDGFL